MAQINVPALTHNTRGELALPNFDATSRLPTDLYGQHTFEVIAGLADKVAVNERKQIAQNNTIAAVLAYSKFEEDAKTEALRIDKEFPVNGEADLAKRQEQYLNSMEGLRQSAREDMPRDVALRFDRHVAVATPKLAFGFKITSLKRLNEDSIAKFDVAEELLAKKAAEGTPDQRDEAMLTFAGLLKDAGKGTYTDINGQTQKGRGFFDSIEIERHRKSFNDRVLTDNLRVSAMIDPEGTMKADALGFYDAVDPVKRVTIMDGARRSRDASLAKAQIQQEKSIKDWKEMVGVATQTHVANQTLTPEWIEEYRGAFTPTEYLAYRKAEVDQRRGSTDFAGNPTIEKSFIPLITDPKANPRDTLTQLQKLYDNGSVGYKFFKEESTRLSSAIAHRDAESRTVLNEADTRIREAKQRSYHAAVTNLEHWLKAGGPFDKFNEGLAVDILTQAMQDLQRNSDYLNQGGTQDSLVYGNKIIPKYAAMLDSRYESSVTILRKRLNYSTIMELEANRGNLSIDQYRDQRAVMIQLNALQTERGRLQKLIRTPIKEPTR